MQVAVGILSILLSFAVLFQSCAVSVGGNISQNQGASDGGAIGILVGIVLLSGGAFVFKLPKIAMYLFIVAGMLALLAGFSDFSDMKIWAVVSGIFAWMSYSADKKKV